MIAFDIELASLVEIPPGGDLDALGPFELSVAAARDDRGGAWTWHGGEPARPAPRMSSADARAVLLHLRERIRAGETVVAWNGVGFDLKWLGAAADDVRLASEVALGTCDPLLQLFHARGFPVSLAAVADGLGITQKKSMSGAEAPRAWARGEHARVIEYVHGDCSLTLEVARRIVERKAVRWITKRGTPASEPMARLLTARELLALPPPDQSWMTTPIRRERFFDWLRTESDSTPPFSIQPPRA
ncbi:MAG: ribonuclease H-like domain-containing protein [Planctomycetes bacterium]|nr:ribonuclease H-like domain-containing protein [Planctomycetota bacterium]